MTPDQFESWQLIEYYRQIGRESQLIRDAREALANIELESACTFTAKDIEFLKEMKIVLL